MPTDPSTDAKAVIAAVQPLVDLVLREIAPYGSVNLDRSWGSWGLTLAERLDYALARAQDAGVDLDGYVPKLREHPVEDAHWVPLRTGAP